MQSHGKGHNLQRYTRNLMVAMPGAGDLWEQLIARTHRFGQTADEINVEMYVHCRELFEAFENARSDARYIEDSTGQVQKLNLATISMLTTSDAVARFVSGDPLWRKR